MFRTLATLAALSAATASLADTTLTLDGRQIAVVPAADGTSALIVDGTTLLSDGVIYLDPTPLTVAGQQVITGVAGAGGNACNAAPFVLALPDGAAPQLFGPADTCAYFDIVPQPDAIVFAGTATPAQPAEIWVWAPATGLTEALPEPFAPDPALGWDAVATLGTAHPVDALRIKPVFDALVAGLGPDWSAFAERISGLGSGSLTALGYVGEACLQITCEFDYAILVIDPAAQQVYANWRIYGEIEPHIFPADPTAWSEGVMEVLRDR